MKKTFGLGPSGTLMGEGTPKICIPIVAETVEEIRKKAEEISLLPAEVVEWRADFYEDIFVETPMIGTNVDTLIIVQAKKDRVEDVEKALNTYREGEINNTMQYPMNIGKVQASRIETIDNYVLFIQLGGSSVDAEEEGEEKVMELSREQNEKALEAIRQALEENSAGSGRTR